MTTETKTKAENKIETELHVLARRYYEWMRVVNYSEWTIDSKRKVLEQFFRWCTERGSDTLVQMTPGLLERYQKHLFYYRNIETARPLSFSSQNMMLGAIKAFFKWLTRKKFLAMNPAGELDSPRRMHRLPKYTLTVKEVEHILMQIDVDKPLGIRDRAILETFYSSGIRRLELTQLSVRDIDMDRGMMIVRQGKGKRDRVVPIGDRALLWIRKYMEEVRPGLVEKARAEVDTDILFLTFTGKLWKPEEMTGLMSKHVTKANLPKTGSCHLFRHTMATVMLEGGADIRFIQKMLGHQQLNTTDIYTHVSNKKLKEVHTALHPAKCPGSRRTGSLKGADDPDTRQINEQNQGDDSLLCTNGT